MLTLLPKKISIEPIIQQVKNLTNLEKQLDLMDPTGNFFSDPWKVKSEFLNTPLGDLLSDLGNIGQSRLLCLESGESYTAHADPDDRIHLAIVTNPYSYLVDIDDEKLYHLPVDGNLWYMNTGKIHVAANWGPRTRIHLNVRVLLPKYNEHDSSLKIKIIDGDYDWKQLAYTPIMALINSGVKNNTITGFKAISDKEVHLNTRMPELFSPAFKSIETSGITLDYQYCI